MMHEKHQNALEVLDLGCLCQSRAGDDVDKAETSSK